MNLKKDKKVVAGESATARISKKSNILETITKHPKSVDVLMSYGLHCVHCMASALDTIEEGAKIHGLEDDVIDEMVARINEVVEHGE
jgi:hybrid cluster-associated redox disulfide protein